MFTNSLTYRNLTESAVIAAGTTFACIKMIQNSGRVIAAIEALQGVPAAQLGTVIGSVVISGAAADTAVRFLLERVIGIKNQMFLHLAGSLAGLAAGYGAGLLVVKFKIVAILLSPAMFLTGIGMTAFFIYKLVSTKYIPLFTTAKLESKDLDIVEHKMRIRKAVEENPFIVVINTLTAFTESILPPDQKYHANELNQMLHNTSSSFKGMQGLESVKELFDMIDDNILAIALMNTVIKTGSQPNFRLVLESLRHFVKQEEEYIAKLQAMNPGDTPPVKPKNFLNTRITKDVLEIQYLQVDFAAGRAPRLPDIHGIANHKGKITWGAWGMKLFLYLLTVARLGELAVKVPLYVIIKALHLGKAFSKDAKMNTDRYTFLWNCAPAVAKLLVVVAPQLLSLHHWNKYLAHFNEVEKLIKSNTAPTDIALREKKLQFYKQIVEDISGPQNIVDACDAAFNSLGKLHT